VLPEGERTAVEPSHGGALRQIIGAAKTAAAQGTLVELGGNMVVTQSRLLTGVWHQGRWWIQRGGPKARLAPSSGGRRRVPRGGVEWSESFRYPSSSDPLNKNRGKTLSLGLVFWLVTPFESHSF
jgi:hypothetical protein